MTQIDSSGSGSKHSIVAVLDRTCEASKGDKTSVREAVESLGHVSYSALILLPALLAITPLSGIPGASSVFGMTIALVSVQMLIGRHHLWLPEWLLRRKVDSGKLRQALGYLRGPAAFVDGHTRQRLLVLIRPPARTILHATCLACGLAMPFLELVPFSSSILGAAVALFATALVVRDGLLAAFGIAILAGAVTLLVQVIA